MIPTSLHVKVIFYGDWLYDTKHSRVTQYRDEFGDEIIDHSAGPQASFTALRALSKA
jgi:hypothetical protein